MTESSCEDTRSSLREPLLLDKKETGETTIQESIISDGDDDEEVDTHPSTTSSRASDQEYILIQHDEQALPPPYALDPRRFAVLFVFGLNNLLSSAYWITFAPIQDAVQVKFHGTTQQQVNWLSLIFMLLYGPGTAFCAYTIRTVGLRKSVVANSAVMALGSLLRWWSCYWITSDNGMAYAILLTGQGIVAAGQPVFANAPARVASAWFQQTTQAIGAASLAPLVGMVLGQAMSPLLVEESTGAHLETLLCGQALAMVACAMATWYCFEEMPAIPPTPAEAARRRQPLQQSTTTASSSSSSSSIQQDLWKLSTDPQYMILVIAFGVSYALSNSTLTLTQPWIAAAGFPGDKTAGLCGALTIAGGTVGTLIAAPWLDATQNYNQAVRVSFAMSFLTAVVTVACLQPGTPVWVLGTAFFVMGMSQFPLLPICIDAAAACTYPLPEELSSAGLQLVGQYLGIVLVDNVMGPLIQTTGTAVGFGAPINLLLLSLLGMSSGLALCYRGRNPRAEANDPGARAGTNSNDSRHSHGANLIGARTNNGRDEEDPDGDET